MTFHSITHCFSSLYLLYIYCRFLLCIYLVAYINISLLNRLFMLITSIIHKTLPLYSFSLHFMVWYYNMPIFILCIPYQIIVTMDKFWIFLFFNLYTSFKWLIHHNIILLEYSDFVNIFTFINVFIFSSVLM